MKGWILPASKGGLILAIKFLEEILRHLDALAKPQSTDFMRLSRAVFTTTGLLLLVAAAVVVHTGISTGLLVAEHGSAGARRLLLNQLQYVGVFAIGWGAGVMGWLISGDKAVICLFARIPRAWGLWREGIFTSLLPIWKYFFGGLLLIGFGVLLSRHVWGIWIGVFDAGMLAGGFVGAIHSLSRIQEVGGMMDFLEANQRYLNKDRVTLFTEYDKP